MSSIELGISGKKAVVTGGSSGIGAAISILLLESGCNVTITARTDKSINDFKKILPSQLYSKLNAITCNFKDEQKVQQLEKHFALSHVDILINCAGINKIGLAEDVTVNEFLQIQRINVEIPFRLSKAVVVGMGSRQWGRIINITSIFGSVSKTRRVSYSTSKFALYGMTKALALDYASSGVLINAVGPGVIETDLTRKVLGDNGMKKIISEIPVGRLGTTKEVAQLVAFLASAANTYLTGQQIIVDGGYTSA
jgi:3-oxoacyl-[acyl-carrier protein] reductase